jgi:hypothetical protein
MAFESLATLRQVRLIEDGLLLVAAHLELIVRPTEERYSRKEPHLPS